MEDEGCPHNEGTYLRHGRLWAWRCRCGLEGRATREDNRPGAAYEDFLRAVERPDLVPDAARAFAGHNP